MAGTCACAWPYSHARGYTTRMRVATNRAGILLAIMRPGQLKNIAIIGTMDPGFDQTKNRNITEPFLKPRNPLS